MAEKTPRFNPRSILDTIDNTVGYVQWRAFIGPPFRESTDSDFYDWSALTLAAYTVSPSDTTLSSSVFSGATTANLTSTSSFPSAGGLWLGPNGTGESWGYATYTGKISNQLTGLTRDTVDAEYSGVHTSGAVARFWWPLDTATAEPVLRETMDSTFSSVAWELTVDGIVAPVPALRVNHLFLMQTRELSGSSWGNWTNFLIGWTMGHSMQDDASKSRPWSLRVAGLNGILMEKEEAGLRVGPPDIADNANITVSSTLSPAYKEANTGEFTGSDPDISEQAMVDNDTSSPWISGGFVGSNDSPGSGITQVHVANYPGQSEGYRWIEVSGAMSGERNLGVGIDYYVPFKNDSELIYEADDKIILAENSTLFAVENPENKATAILALENYQLWNRNNNKQTVDLAGATGGTFTLTWDRSGSWTQQTTGNLNYNATAQEVTDAFAALTDVDDEDVFVTGSAGGPFSITFTRTHGSTADIATLVLNSSLTGGGTPTVTRNQDGGSAFDTGSTADTLFDQISASNGVLLWQQIATDVQQVVAWGSTYSIWAQDVTQGIGNTSNKLWAGAILTAPTAGQTMRRTATPGAIADNATNWSVSSVATPGYKMVAYDAGPPEIQATKEWVYFDLPTMGLSLSADIDNSVTSFVIAKEGEASVDGLPDSGAIQIGIEQMTYSSLDRDTGTVTIALRGAGSTTAALHSAGDVVYFLVGGAGGVATEAYPIDTIQIERPTGFSVPEDFVIRGSELSVARTPDEENYTNDYTTYATVTANASTSYSLDLSATAPRIRYLLIEVTKMSVQPSRVKINELRVLVDGDVMNSDKYLASGTVAAAMDTLLQAAGIPSGAITDNADTQTVSEYTTQTDLLWPVLVDLAEFTNSRITVGRDSKITLQADPFWGISGTPSEASQFTRTEAAYVEINKTPARNVGQVELTWRPPANDAEYIATFPSSYTTGRKIKVGPYVYADSTAATAGVTKRYYQLRRPYDVVVELAQQSNTIRAGTIRGLQWQLHDSQLAQDRTYLCTQSAHTIRNFGWNTVLTLLQLNRTDER